jgi:hypothetical protein
MPAPNAVNEPLHANHVPKIHSAHLIGLPPGASERPTKQRPSQTRCGADIQKTPVGTLTALIHGHSNIVR